MVFAPGAFFRLLRAGHVMLREGVVTLLAPPDPPAGARLILRAAAMMERSGARQTEGAARLTRALEKLGPSYVKLGQFLATRPDIVGPAVAAELTPLQDRLPAFSMDAAQSAIEDALDQPLAQVYQSFSDPVAAASIAQVHRAVIVDDVGTERTVAVKILRPDVESRFARDVECFYLAARSVERFMPRTRRLRPIAVVDTLARSVELEMDLRLEAAALSEMAENTADDPGFHVPGVDWTRSARRVLTLDWVDGIKLSDLDGLEKAGIDFVATSRNIIQSFLRHALRDGFFHADMHQGNLFIDDTGRLVAVDFGIMGRLSPKERRFLAEILYGFITRNYRRVAEVHFEAGYVPADQDVEMFAQALRAIGEPLQGHAAKDISMARLLTQLFEVTELFNMHTQPQLILLQKTMVVVEGVARSLDPDLNMWTTADPVVRAWIERHLGPAGQLEKAGDGISAIGRLVNELPDLADRAGRLSADMAQMADTGLKLDPETISAIGRAEARQTRWGRIALWVIAGAALVIALW